MLQDKSKKVTDLLMSKVPVIARNLCYKTLTNGSWEADYGPGYREGEGGRNPTSSLPKKLPPYPNLLSA